MNQPRTLNGLLRWAHRAYLLETPSLDHSAKHTDDSGAPEMKPAPAAYLGLLAKRQLDNRPDDWRALACRRVDGRRATPLRCAIESIPSPARRRLLRDLVPELYFPGEVLAIHGVPRDFSADVAVASLTQLYATYQRILRDDEAKERPAGWVDLSESQRAAVEAGEAA